MGAENIEPSRSSMLGVKIHAVVSGLAALAAFLPSLHAQAQRPAHIAVTESPEIMEPSTRERIQERLSSVSDRIGECFADGSSRSNSTLSFDVTLDRDGVVQRLRTATESDPDVERCVRPVLQRLRFDPSSTAMTFRISVAPRALIGVLTAGGGGVAAGGFGQVGAGRGRGRPTPQVRVGSAAVRGSLAPEVIRRVIRRHINRVRYCYERELQSDSSLHGRITVRFIISPTGTVQSASASADTMGSGPVQSCVIQVIRTLRFPAPAGGGVVAVTYPFVFRPGGSSANGPGSPGMLPRSVTANMVRPVLRPGNATVRGRLDRADIMRVIRRNHRAVRRCYERELQRHPNSSGRVIVRFEVRANGRVGSARVTSNTVESDAVADCVARQVRRWRFPQPEGGGSVTVSYPFVFTTR